MTAVLALTAASLAAPALTQDRKPLTFSAQVEMVNLTVSVIDEKNRYVQDLSQAQFTVFENGDRQAVSVFEKQELPVRLILLIDASPSMTSLASATREAATKFVRTLRPQDQASVVSFGDRSRVLQDFTNDKSLLEQAVTEFQFKDEKTKLYLDLYTTLKEFDRQDFGEQCRRVIILLTDGEDTASPLTDDQVVEEAGRHNIIVYGILIPRAPNTGQGDWQKNQRARSFLSQVAAATGGTAYIIANPWVLKDAYELIAQELRMQYRLGYYPTHAKNPGPARTITVFVGGHANVTVQHRKTYLMATRR